MHLVTHINSDFDALASMVAASFLYPGVTWMVPSQVQPAVREFLTLHWDLLQGMLSAAERLPDSR
jgi:tRNA nucleotidyltransferase (CCA-adding enzyme)